MYCPQCGFKLDKWEQGDIFECTRCGSCYDEEVLITRQKKDLKHLQ